jgi:hypothetical protein
MTHLRTALIAVAALAATPALAQPGTDSDAKLAKALAGRVAGPAVDCINQRNITSSRIIDGRAILYQVGSTLYVNTPRSGASDLDDDSILVTNTFTGQLCSIDTVKLVDRSSRFQRGVVFLDKFVPYKKPAKR